MIASLGKVDPPILDDRGLSSLTQRQRIGLLGILEERHGRGSNFRWKHGKPFEGFVR